LLATVPAVPMKLALVVPPVTVTKGGMVSAALFEESVTRAPFRDPPEGAGDVSVTVQVVFVDDGTELGEHATLETAAGGGFTVTEAVALPLNVAVTVAV